MEKEIEMPDKVYLINKDKEVRFLSSFSAHSIVINGKIYETTEHYFQSAKFFHTDPEWAEEVRKANGPKLSAKLGRSRDHKIDENWDKCLAMLNMEKALIAKSQQHQEVMDQLMATGDSYIVERADWDSIWGDGPYKCGKNQLGRLWMKVRSDLRKLNGKS